MKRPAKSTLLARVAGLKVGPWSDPLLDRMWLNGGMTPPLEFKLLHYRGLIRERGDWLEVVAIITTVRPGGGGLAAAFELLESAGSIRVLLCWNQRLKEWLRRRGYQPEGPDNMQRAKNE